MRAVICDRCEERIQGGEQNIFNINFIAEGERLKGEFHRECIPDEIMDNLRENDMSETIPDITYNE